VGTRFTYDEGVLEIMVVSIAHEDPNRTLGLLVRSSPRRPREISTLPVRLLSSERIWRKDSEPDSCFYIRRADQVRGKAELDLMKDPPPDLVIE